MGFLDAMAYMLVGKHAKRKGWYIKLRVVGTQRAARFETSDGAVWVPYPADIMALDWEVSA